MLRTFARALMQLIEVEVSSNIALCSQSLYCIERFSNLFIFLDYTIYVTTNPFRSRWVGAWNSHSKPMSRHFYRLIYFLVYLFFCERKAVPVQWRSEVKSVSCDWSWLSHGSLIPGKFDLKINRSMKTLWQEYSGVVCSYSSAPGNDDCIWNEVNNKINVNEEPRERTLAGTNLLFSRHWKCVSQRFQ